MAEGLRGSPRGLSPLQKLERIATETNGSADAPPESPLRANQRRRVALLLGIAAVVVAAGALWYLNAGPGHRGGPAGSVVGDFAGSAGQKTDPFFVRSGWQIQWKSDGTSFRLAVRGDVDVGVVVDQQSAGSGVTSPVPAGNFYLEISGNGPWQVKVIQGD